MTEYGLITVLVNDETIKKEISDLIEKALEEYKKNTEIEWVIQ